MTDVRCTDRGLAYLRRLIGAIPNAQVGRLRATYCVREMEIFEMEMNEMEIFELEMREMEMNEMEIFELEMVLARHAGRLDIIACLCTRY